MTKKYFIGGLAVVAMLVGYLCLHGHKDEKKYTIGIVVPVEHRAMDEMIRGFRQTLTHQYGDDVEIEVQNAQGDLNLQKAIIQNFSRKGVDHIVSIGTDVTLMAANSIKHQSVIGLDVTSQVKQNHMNVTGVLESPIQPSYHFLKSVIHPLKKVTMVYSSSDKNYQMVQEFTQLAKRDGIIVQPIMIQSLVDLYVLASSVDKDSDVIFISKDHMVASGAALLAKSAAKLHIPLVTSDQGSVVAGGAIALGNREADIGRAGAKLVISIIDGETPQAIPMTPVSDYTVFLNLDAMVKQRIEPDRVIQTANQFGYHVEFVQTGGVI